MLLLIALASAAAFLGGVSAGNRTKVNPTKYWAYLGAGLVFSTAFMVGGYTWYDEFFLAGFLLADPVVRSKRRPADHSIVSSSRWTVFVAFCIYALIEAIRALFFFASVDGGAVQKARWIFFFLLLILVAAKSRQLIGRGIRPTGTARSVTSAGLAFTAVWALFSTVAFVWTGTFAGSQFAQRPQDRVSPFLEIFGTSAYVNVVYVLVVPAALICLGSARGQERRLAGATLVTVFATLVALNSRIGMLYFVVAVVAFLVNRVATSKLKGPELLLVPLLVVVPIAVTAAGESSLDKVADDMLRTLHLSDDVSDRQDIDRRIWFEASFDSLNNSDPFYALFGYGLRTSGYVVAPYVQQGFWQYARVYKDDTDVAVEGFTAIAVDMGYVGLSLFLVLILGSAWAVLRDGGQLRFVVVLVPLGMFVVTLVANVFDCLLLYAAIMPWGLTEAIGPQREEIGVAPESRVTRSRRIPGRRT